MAGAGILMTPLGKRLRQEAEMLWLSRKLVALKTDVQVGVTWKALQYSF
jgi:DNA polymerase-1